jgi:hypothetical protein
MLQRQIDGLKLLHGGKVYEVVQSLVLQVLTDCLARSYLKAPRKVTIAFDFTQRRTRPASAANR